MDLKEREWEGVDLIDPVQDRDQRWAPMETVMNFRVP
jgi:hypothetical protein